MKIRDLEFRRNTYGEKEYYSPECPLGKVCYSEATDPRYNFSEVELGTYCKHNRHMNTGEGLVKCSGQLKSIQYINKLKMRRMMHENVGKTE